MNNIDQLVAPEGSGRLESLKQRFTEWLQSVHSGKRKVSEKLWQAAVAVDRFSLVSRIAKELGRITAKSGNIYQPLRLHSQQAYNHSLRIPFHVCSEALRAQIPTNRQRAHR